MTTPELDKRRLAKFLERADRAMSSDVALMGINALQITITTTIDKQSREVTETELRFPTATEDQLWLCMARCRTFLLKSEDTYLPHVARAIYNLAPTNLRPGLQPLVDLVNSQIKDGELAEGVSWQGRVGMDNGYGPGKLQGSHQITMDYMYGFIFHEDEDRRARLQSLRHQKSVESAVLMQLAHLLILVRKVREQVVVGLSQGWLPEVDDSKLFRAE